MKKTSQTNIFNKSPLSLSSALLASVFLCGCGGESIDNANVPDTDNANVPDTPNLPTSKYTSLSCISPGIYESDDKFVMLDVPGFISDIERESENDKESDMDFLWATIGWLSGSLDASGLGVPLMYCDYDRAKENNCSDNINLGGEASMGTKGTGVVKGNWLSFDAYNIDNATSIETREYTFSGEAPRFWNGKVTGYESDGSVSVTAEWSRSDNGDEHYLSNESDGGYTEFFENADCSGSMSSLRPDAQSLEISWSATTGSEVSGEYTICYLNRTPVECVSKDFHVAK